MHGVYFISQVIHSLNLRSLKRYNLFDLCTRADTSNMHRRSYTPATPDQIMSNWCQAFHFFIGILPHACFDKNVISVLGIVDCLPKRSQATVGVMSSYPDHTGTNVTIWLDNTLTLVKVRRVETLDYDGRGCD